MFKRIAGLFMVVVGLGLAAPALAQDMAGAPIRIGLILPAVPTAKDDLRAPIATAAEQGAVMAE
ncbi:MAG TPA: hypothetical protein VL147_16710 [Devosia sp.]|nr:hypothetical protein [Devosia sp.]